MPNVGSETVTVHTGLSVDRYGDPSGAPTSYDIDGAFTAPAGTADVAGRSRDGVTWDLDVYLPYAAQVTERDELEIGGDRYTIDGAPQRWRQPFTGWEAVTVVRAKRASG